jgi:RNA polymerase sigma-70 factor (ECF subfamily)
LPVAGVFFLNGWAICMGEPRLQPDPLLAMLEQHGPSVLGYLLALLPDRQQAEDVLQETFLRAWQARHRYAESGRQRAWLLRIAHRRALDRLRRNRREAAHAARRWRLGPGQPPVPSPAAVLVQEEAQAQVREALGALSPQQRQALLLRYYGELGFDEIARLMACPLNTVLSHARRGLLALRKLLVEEHEC